MLFCVLLVSTVLFYVLFVLYCHRVATQLQLNISYYITSYRIISYHTIFSILIELLLCIPLPTCHPWRSVEGTGRYQDPVFMGEYLPLS